MARGIIYRGDISPAINCKIMRFAFGTDIISIHKNLSYWDWGSQPPAHYDPAEEKEGGLAPRPAHSG
jgi:hypothetical protein